MSYPYYFEDSGWYYYGKEISFRTNGQGKDTAHLVGDTVFPIPLILEDGYAWIRQRKDFKRVWTAGSKFMSHVSFVGYKDLIIRMSGPVLTHDLLMYFCTDICITKGVPLGTPFADTIASGQGTTSVVMTTHTSMTINEHAGRMMENATSSLDYNIISNSANTLVLNRASSASADGDTIAITEAPFTHQCDDADTFPSTPPTFQMVRILTNHTGAESIAEQFCGCTVVSYDERADSKGQLIGTYEIHAALVITGNVPTTRPERTNLRVLTLADAVLTWNSNLGNLQSWSFTYKTDKKLLRGAGDYYPIIPLLPNKVEMFIELKWVPYETDTYDESQDDPHAAGNKDLVCKFSRDTVADYWQITIDDYFQDMLEDPDFEQGIINEIHRIEVNPHDSGSKWDLTEVNALNNDRYDT